MRFRRRRRARAPTLGRVFFAVSLVASLVFTFFSVLGAFGRVSGRFVFRGFRRVDFFQGPAFRCVRAVTLVDTIRGVEVGVVLLPFVGILFSGRVTFGIFLGFRVTFSPFWVEGPFFLLFLLLISLRL